MVLARTIPEELPARRNDARRRQAALAPPRDVALRSSPAGGYTAFVHLRLGSLGTAALLSSACLTSVEAPPPAVDPALEACAGRWIARHPKSVVGRGHDSVLEIERGPEGWTIRFDSVVYPGVVKPGRVTYARGEPRALRIDGDRLAYDWPLYSEGELRAVEQTFLIEPERLTLPAWVERDARTWAYVQRDSRFLIRTEHDPHEVPTGNATLEGFPLLPTPVTYHAAVQESLAANGQDSFVIRFTQTDSAGAPVELGALVEDPEWHLWFQHTTTIGEQRWERLDEREWERLRALPDAPRRP